jgi:hypothetical protein
MTRGQAANSLHSNGYLARPAIGPRQWEQAWHAGYLDAMFGHVEVRTGPPPPMEWRTGVEDATGRPREIVVTEADGRITVSLPPGEGFSINPDQADLLALALLSASNCAPSGRDCAGTTPGLSRTGVGTGPGR